MKLSERIKQTRFASPAQEALLNILVTSSWLLNELSALMAPFGVTPTQYNVLRILRGSHPGKLTCMEIGRRMLDRTPDVTRLLNRLERAGLVTRSRASHDKRVVEVGITEKGLELLARMQPVVDVAQERLMSRLSPEELRLLSELLDRLRVDDASEEATEGATGS
ncbi:MarR family winged helix-turn-helix transcriptional regulator [Rhodothermus marinus]|uniref:Transcriptional regulator, MarR family n=1 Tax=Rhodothermus marinus (strain ATCC 43812 / DSM 4252 / R-10) TaxID=518766 RepID=D0MGI5_RHOM4|nr:MarR family transcriptional regulator [Rhodothermus marinus]ACY49548.1 transcriptional regulator, MarR family [Rhodothermus marinus DSM 4252]